MWIFILLTVLVHSQAVTWDDVSTNIVVVEFQPITNGTEDERVLANVDHYIEILTEVNDTLMNGPSKHKNLDLIVFPEGSLKVNYSTAIEIKVNDTPSTSNSYPDYMKILSQAAKDYSTYLVTNLVEKVACENQNTSDSKNCRERGFYYYNTDVIFDRTGKIINKYHKLNLFGEKNRDRAPTVEVVTFETDFGFKFGIFTCFDILFKHPAEDVVAQNVDAIVYPTNWHSELPFLTALQSQQMWAYAHKTTIFAAGGNNPLESSGGSGFFRGDSKGQGSVLTGLVAKGGSKILIYGSDNGQINSYDPVDSDEKAIDALALEMEDFPLWQDDSLKDYSSKVVDFHQTDLIEEQVCSGDFCCNFNIKLSDFIPTSSHFYIYHMVAYNAVRKYPGIGDGGFEVCGVVACPTSEVSSCGKRLVSYPAIDWPTTFENISITADFEINENKTQFPNTLLSSIRPIDTSQTSWTSEEVEVDGSKVLRRTFSTTKAQSRLLTFAIFGRNFALDALPVDNAGISEKATWLILSLALMSYFFA